MTTTAAASDGPDADQRPRKGLVAADPPAPARVAASAGRMRGEPRQTRTEPGSRADAGPAALRRGAWRGLATWWTLSGALVLLQVGGSALVIARGFFYQDDYVFISRAVEHPLFSRELLLEHWSGHLMPAGMAASWGLAHAAPFSYVPVIVALVGMLAAAAILFRLLARQLFGPGRAHVLAVLLYATSMPVLAASAWWAAAINVLPLQIALFTAALLLVGAPTSAHRLSVVMTVAAGLLFFEKAVLIPFVLFGLCWARSAEPRWGRSMRRTWAAERRLWLGLGAMLVVYGGVYMATADGASPAGLPLPRTAADTLSRGLSTLVTSLVGGPLHWVIGFEALAIPPLWLVVAAFQVLVLGVAGTLAASGRVNGRWLLLGALTSLAGLLLLLVGRPDGAALLAAAPRYFADTIPVVALAVAGAAAAARGTITPDPPSGRAPGAADRRAAWALLAGANAVLLLAVASSAGVVAWLAYNPSRGYVTTTVDALQGLDEPTSILNTAVPPFVLGPLAAPANRQANVFALVSEDAEYLEQLDELTVVPPGGGIAPGTLRSPLAASNLPGPEPQCGWRIVSDRAIPLQKAAEGSALAIGYIATAGGTVDVSVGDAPATRMTLLPGLHRTYLSVQGTGASISFANLTDGVQVCTDELTFGTPLAAGP